MSPAPVRVRPVVIATVDGRYVDIETGEPPKPGNIFYQPMMLLSDDWKRHLSAEFWESYRKRERYPIVLVLPDGHYWSIDGTASNARPGHGWTVYNIPPLDRITVRASIRTGTYHGILTDGVLNPCADSQT